MSSTLPSAEFVARLPVRANRNGEGEQYYPVFNIMRSRMEEQIGRKLASGGFYHITGSIQGAFDFDVHRVVRSYFRMVTPLEHRDKIVFGKVYSVCIKSIEEVQLNEKQREIVANAVGVQYRPLMYRLRHAVGGRKAELRSLQPEKIAGSSKVDAALIPERVENINAQFATIAHLHTRVDNRRYFVLPNAQFELKTGLKLEEMRDYVIHGEIRGVGGIRKVLLRCAARQDIPIYVSSKLSKRITIGKEYLIRIDSVEKLLRPKPWEGLKLDELRPWSWRELASWVDTEGAVCCPTERGGTYQILISQKERKVLAEIALFLDAHGVSSSLLMDKTTGVYNLHVFGAGIVARVIKEIEPFIRTENKIAQISEFKKSICRQRKKLWPSIREARDVLGLTDKAS
jgi:hypothetical protein